MGGGRASAWLCLAIWGALFAAPWVAHAQPSGGDGPDIARLDSIPPHDATETNDAVGIVSLSMQTCDAERNYLRLSDGRSVRAQLERVPPGFGTDNQLIEAILAKAARFAWKSCPVPYVSMMGEDVGEYHYDIRQITIVGPDGTELYQGGVGPKDGDMSTGDQATRTGHHYYWRNLHNLAAERAAVQAREGPWLAAVAQRQQAASAAIQAGKRDEAFLWKWAGWAVVAWCLWWLWRRREIALRWYYFNFHPHPAERMVRQATDGSAPLNENALLQALGEVPLGNAIFRNVRIEQGERLIAEMRAAAAGRERAHAEALRTKAAAEHEREAFFGMQESIAQAAVGLERAKAAAAKANELRRKPA